MIATFLITALVASFALFALFFMPSLNAGRNNVHAGLLIVRERLRAELADLDAQTTANIVDASAAESERRRLEHELVECLRRLDGMEEAKPALAKQYIRFPVFLLLGSLVLVSAGATYFLSHRVPLSVLFGSVTQPQVPPEVLKMVTRLEQRLARQPEDAQGWALLGRSYAVLGRDEEANTAFSHAYALAPNDTRVIGLYAMWLYQRDPTRPTQKTADLFRKLYKLDNKNVSAMWVLGLADFNHAKYKSAVAMWEKMLPHIAKDSAAYQQVKNAIERARQQDAAGIN